MLNNIPTVTAPPGMNFNKASLELVLRSIPPGDIENVYTTQYRVKQSA